MGIKTLVEALSLLDKDNDDHWTSEGLPRLEVVKELCNKPVTRAEITQSAKGFSRTNMDVLNSSLPVETEVAVESKPEMTGDGADVNEGTDEGTDEGVVTDESEVTSDEAEENVDEETAAKAALIAARLKVKAANKVLLEATAKMDAIISAKTVKVDHTTQAKAVKSYQAAQLAEREKTTAKRIEVAQLIKSMDLKTNY